MKNNIVIRLAVISLIGILGLIIISISACEINENKNNAIAPAYNETSDEETPASNLIVLAYHDITDNNSVSEGSSLNINDFKQQMAYLYENNYQTMGLEQFLNYYNKGKFPEKCVMITFDDGYQSFLQLAYPIFKEYNFHAVIFPIVSMTPGLEKDIVWTQHLTFHDLRLMDKESGLIDIGSHTYDLHYYRDDGGPAIKRQKGETKKAYKSRIKEDLSVGKEILELQTGQNIIALAWPYGITNSTAVKIAKELDYQLLFTLYKGPVTPDTSLDHIPRYAVSSGSMKDFQDILKNCQ